jgi:hypothetical protein
MEQNKRSKEAAMREGLLWYDGDKRRAAIEKLDLAAARYLERFGREPNQCHVHPDQVFEHPTVRIVGDATILPNHFWIGEDEELAAELARARRRRRKIA